MQIEPSAITESILETAKTIRAVKFERAVACQRPSYEKVSLWCSRWACYGSVLAHLALRLNWPQLSQFNHPAALMQSNF